MTDTTAGDGIIVQHEADLMLDNIACATQNRALLRGDPAEDKVLTAAVLENGKQAISRAITKALAAQPSAGAPVVAYQRRKAPTKGGHYETEEAWIDCHPDDLEHYRSMGQEIRALGVIATPAQPEWVVNDNAELGVKVGSRFYWLYKGDSLVYGNDPSEVIDGIVQHDDGGGPMHWRPVFKREFGECAHPVNYKDPTQIGTVSLDDSEQWQVLPAPPGTPAQPPAHPVDIVPSHCTGASLSFEPGVLHVKKDGSGYIAIDERHFSLEDDRCDGPDGPEGSVHWITRMDASEMVALRDFLNGSTSTTAQPGTVCKTCGGKGHTEHEGGDSTQSIVEYETCPTCTAQPDTGDVAALREAFARIIDPTAWELFDTDPEAGNFVGITTDASLAKAERILATLSKPNAQGRVG